MIAKDALHFSLATYRFKEKSVTGDVLLILRDSSLEERKDFINWMRQDNSFNVIDVMKLCKALSELF